MDVETPVYNCPDCDEPTAHNVLKAHVRQDENPPEQFVFATCQKSGNPALFFREDMGDGFASDPFYRLYPKNERHLSFALPQLVRDSYHEAVLCEGGKAWIAWRGMVGRT